MNPKKQPVMNPKKIMFKTLIAFALTCAVAAQAASSSTVVLTSGDAGGGLTLDPINVVAALHFGSDNNTYTLQGVSFPNNFGQPNSPYFTVPDTFSSPGFQGLFNVGMPTFGSGGSASSTNLGMICSSIYFGRTTASAPGAGFNFTISSLPPYSTNKIEFIHNVGSFGPRQQIITVNTGMSGGTLSETNTEANGIPLNSQFTGIVADGTGKVTGRFSQGSFGDGSWVNAVIITFQGQGPVPIYTWNGAPNGNWNINATTNWILSTSGNLTAWTNGVFTRFNDTAAGTTTVNETTVLTPVFLTVSNNAASYTFTGNGSISGVKLLKQGGGILTILSTNSFANGDSEIQNGTVVFAGSSSNGVTGQLLVASVSNVLASLVVTNNANLAISASFYVGLAPNSTGTLVAANSSIVNNTASFTSIGGGGVGIATIQDAATFNGNTSGFNIGDSTGSHGTLNLKGNAKITAGSIYVGKSASALGTVNQTGGSLASLLGGAQEFQIGRLGQGAWNQSGGTNTVANWVSIGRFSGGSGSLIVSGGSFNQTNLTRGLLVGEEGIGTLTINGSGLVTSVSPGVGVTVGYAATGSGTLNLDGGTLVAQVVQGGSGSGSFNFNGGTLKAGPGANANFMSFLSTATVLSGGAIIDSDSNSITIAQTLNDGGGGLTKIGNGTLTLTAGNNYSGPTVVSAGKLAVTTATTTAGGYSVATAAELSLMVLSGNAQISPANLTVGNSTLDFDLGNFGNPANSGAPWNLTGNLAVNGTVTINIADALPQVGQFPLIKYGSLSGSGGIVLGTVPIGVVATIVTNNVNSSIDLNITAVKLPEWSGLAGGNWDVGITTNWVTFGSGNPTYFAQGDVALFDDSALGTTSANLVGTLNPAVVTITNNSLNYSFKGSGSIGGSGGLVKQGTASLTITNAGGNTYTGATVLQGGSVIVRNLANGGASSAIGAASSNPTNLVFAGGTLSYQGTPTTINRGYSVQSGGGTLDAQNNLTLSGSVTAAGGSGFAKTGAATLTYTTAGSNTLSGGAFPSYDVMAGTVIFDGSGGQTNTVNGEFWAGDATSGNISVLLKNTVLNTSSYFNVGRNAAAGNISTLTLTNATLSQGNGLVLGYYDTPFTSPLISTQIVTISGSSVLNSPGDTFVAAMGGSAGTLNAGNTSTLTVGGNLFIATHAYADGTLNISDTSSVTINNPAGGGAFVAGYNNYWGGDALSKTGRVNQVGGTFTVKGDLQIGSQGDGTWNISGGNVVANGWTTVGRFPAGIGHLNVSGGIFTQTGTNGNALLIAEQGLGNMTVAGTGLVNCFGSSGLVIGGGDGAGTPGYGTVNLNGGTIATKSVYLAGIGYSTGTLNFNGGTLKAAANTINFMHDLTLANVQTNGAVLDDGGFAIGIPQVLVSDPAGDGGLTKLGSGTLTLSGVNTYTNTTTVSNGTLLVSGTIAGNATVKAGATLGGNGGSIGGSVTIKTNGTFALGASVGTLTIGNTLTFNSGSAGVFKLNRSLTPSNDLATVNGTITANGSLTVTNQGPALASGDSFRLFSHAVSGSFSPVILPNLPPGSSWTNRLAIDGSIAVVTSVNTNPTNITATVSGNNLTLMWPADHTGWRLQSQTNLLSVGIATNWFNVAGATTTNQVVIPINPANPTVFYRMVYP